MIKEGILYRELPDGKIECYACARLCKIPKNSHGFCYVRQNRNGELVLINYGVIAAMQIDPIEKKPFNHFMPGTTVFGIGTSSCNWGCQFCQNHNISKDKEIEGVEMSPDAIVDMALRYGTKGIAFTYNEPTIFIEYALDVARLAKKNGLFTIFVTNGYMTKEAVHEMKGLIDAAVVDFKGNGEQKFSNKFEMVVSTEPIKEAVIEMKRVGIHVEMTDLIIPKVGDSLEACDELTRWIASIDLYIPIQFTRFHPDYKMTDYISTPYETLKAHYDIARRNGLKYVYIGNVPGNPYEHTYCPNCNSIAIGRYGFDIINWNLDKAKRCKKCRTEIAIVGNVPKELKYRGIVSLY